MTKEMTKQVTKLCNRIEAYFNSLNDLEEKIENDTKYYGKPLGNKGLTDRVNTHKRRLIEAMDFARDKLAKKHKPLSARDAKVLKAIRENDTTINTGVENTYKYDNRYSGSASSRKFARDLRRNANGNN